MIVRDGFRWTHHFFNGGRLPIGHGFDHEGQPTGRP